MIDLQILGRTALRRDGQSLDSFLRGPKRLGLLAYLVLARPRGFHRRDELLPLFWPERGQTSARNALSNMLYHIRQALGDGVIVNRGAEEIGVQRDRLSCDAIAFEAALDRGDYKDALDLYRGDLLQGFHVPDAAPAFDQWLDQERERLRLRAAEGAWSLADEAEQASDREAARSWAKKAAGFAPFSDEAQTRLITLLKRIGDRTAARGAYEAFAERLRTEWDMEPTEDLKALVDTVGHDGAAKTMSSPAAHALPSSNRAGSVSSNPADSTDSHTPADVKAASLPSVGVGLSPKINRRALLAGAVLLVLSVGLVWVLWSVGPTQETPQETPQETLPPFGADPSVAVLPFTYIGADDSTDYFSLGMTEEILTRLAQVSDLSVISRTSVMRYRNTEKPLRTIGEELGARTVVEGSVQRAGDQVHITAQLIDAQTDYHLWSASYNRALEDILTVQSDVATRIAEALEAELLSEERAQLTSHQRSVDAGAYHLYLRAQHLQDTRDPAGIVQAKTLYEEAIQQDTSFALAYGGLAMAYVRSALVDRMHQSAVQVAGLPSEAAIPLALQAADQALRHDSTVVAAYIARGLAYHIFEHEWERSEQAFQRALAINPNHSETLQEYGLMHLRLGRLNQALPLMQRAVDLDPFSGSAHMGLGYTYHCLRRYEDAIQELETALSLDSASPFTPKYIGHVHIVRARELTQAGREDAAATHLGRAVDMMDMIWGPDPTHRMILDHAIAGRNREALELLNNVGYSGPRLWLFSLITPPQMTFDRVTQHGFVWGVFADPLFDPVRDDPRFEQVVERKLRHNIDVRQRGV